MSFIGVAVKK
jgi:hypothetical protein